VELWVGRDTDRCGAAGAEESSDGLDGSLVSLHHLAQLLHALPASLGVRLAQIAHGRLEDLVLEPLLQLDGARCQVGGRRLRDLVLQLQAHALRQTVCRLAVFFCCVAICKIVFFLYKES
jgi:hypothetical protein